MFKPGSSVTSKPGPSTTGSGIGSSTVGSAGASTGVIVNIAIGSSHANASVTSPTPWIPSWAAMTPPSVGTRSLLPGGSVASSKPRGPGISEAISVLSSLPASYAIKSIVVETGIPSSSKRGSSITAMNASFVETNIEPIDSEAFVSSAVTVTVVD